MTAQKVVRQLPQSAYKTLNEFPWNIELFLAGSALGTKDDAIRSSNLVMPSAASL